MYFRLACLLATATWLTACDTQPAETDSPSDVPATVLDSVAYDPDASSDSARMGKAGGVAVGGVALTAERTIAQNLAASSEFSQLSQLAKLAELTATLEGDGPYTVFAPTNAAFGRLPYGALAGLTKPESKANLQGLLQYHIIQSRLLAVDLRNGQQISTMSGQRIKIKVKGTQLTVNGAAVTMPDVVSKNGVVHVIDQVLLPPAQ